MFDTDKTDKSISNSTKRVRTRFAPSPTGYVHIGSVQKMVYSYACAKKFGGDYILRIEDTDRTRFVEDAEQGIHEVHKVLGMQPDESPENPGKYGPYRQSERLELYKKYAEQLIAEGKAYYAFETPEELEVLRAAQRASGDRARFRSEYRNYTPEQAQELLVAGKKAVVRVRMPEHETITYTDMIMGEISFNSDDLDDYVLLKSDGFPTYHLAVIVDDHLMEITHVFRGVEWIATSPLHVLLYKYFGWEMPEIAHIPNILDPKGGKLSKRSGSVAVSEFLANGYLPEAIINFMILLGWSPKTEQEFFSLEEFVKIFSLDNFNKSNPVFNREKLDWFNGSYIRKFSLSELAEKLKQWVAKYMPEDKILSALTPEQLEQAIALEQERAVTLKELYEKLNIFVNRPEKIAYDHKLVKKLTHVQLRTILSDYKQQLESNTQMSHEQWETMVRNLAEKLELKAGSVFMTLRLAITGLPATPPLFELTEVLGGAEHLERITAALNSLPADENT
jgi:glutamyl-tRNA synthetase